MGDFDDAMAQAKVEAEAATSGGPPPVQMRPKAKKVVPASDKSNPFAANPFAPAPRPPSSALSESSDDRKSVDGKAQGTGLQYFCEGTSIRNPPPIFSFRSLPFY